MKWTQGLPRFNQQVRAEFLYTDHHDMLFSVHFRSHSNNFKVYNSRHKAAPLTFDTLQQAKMYCETTARIMYDAT